jgi:hypothetical protein
MLDHVIAGENKFKIIVRFIVSIDRAKSVETARESFECFLKFKNNPTYTKYLVGFDLCGNSYKNDFS